MSTENLNMTDFIPIIYHGHCGMKNKGYMTAATYEPGTAHPSRAEEFTPPSGSSIVYFLCGILDRS